MVSVFAIFVVSHGIEFKQRGVGMATAVLLDALIVRAFVLPALLDALGVKVWWPSRPVAVTADYFGACEPAGGAPSRMS